MPEVILFGGPNHGHVYDFNSDKNFVTTFAVKEPSNPCSFMADAYGPVKPHMTVEYDCIRYIRTGDTDHLGREVYAAEDK